MHLGSWDMMSEQIAFFLCIVYCQIMKYMRSFVSFTIFQRVSYLKNLKEDDTRNVVTVLVSDQAHGHLAIFKNLLKSVIQLITKVLS